MSVLVDGELVLFGTVGDDLWGDGFTARDVVEALAEAGRGTDVSVRLNSGGGYASEGAAIYNALSAHRGKVTVYVDGVAASAASLLAMAGDEVVMRRGSVMMIHDPAGFTMGSARDHEKSIESLNALADSFADIYAQKSGKTVKQARADMREEIWLTPDQAIERGYANSKSEADAVDPIMFAYHLYKHAPRPLMAADISGPTKSDQKKAATAASQRQKELPMPEPKAVEHTAITEDEVNRRIQAAVAETKAKADEAVTANRTRCRDILACDEAKGREELAHNLAFETDLTVDQVKAALAKAPKVELVKPNGFEAAMQAAGNPRIGPDAPHEVTGVSSLDNIPAGSLKAQMQRQLGIAKQ